MPQDRPFTSPVGSILALLGAFAICFVVIVFSWPDSHDRKRAVAPKLAECCEVKIGNTVIFSRRTPPAQNLGGEAAIVPAAMR